MQTLIISIKQRRFNDSHSCAWGCEVRSPFVFAFILLLFICLLIILSIYFVVYRKIRKVLIADLTLIPARSPVSSPGSSPGSIPSSSSGWNPSFDVSLPPGNDFLMRDTVQR